MRAGGAFFTNAIGRARSTRPGRGSGPRSPPRGRPRGRPGRDAPAHRPVARGVKRAATKRGRDPRRAQSTRIAPVRSFRGGPGTDLPAGVPPRAVPPDRLQPSPTKRNASFIIPFPRAHRAATQWSQHLCRARDLPGEGPFTPVARGTVQKPWWVDQTTPRVIMLHGFVTSGRAMPPCASRRRGAVRPGRPPHDASRHHGFAVHRSCSHVPQMLRAERVSPAMPESRVALRTAAAAKSLSSSFIDCGSPYGLPRG